MKAHTKEEKFILTLHDLAEAAGDPQAEISRYAIGEKIGMHPKGIDTICNQLAQANFIKKVGDVLVYLTPNGERLYQSLIEEA